MYILPSSLLPSQKILCSNNKTSLVAIFVPKTAQEIQQQLQQQLQEVQKQQIAKLSQQSQQLPSLPNITETV